MKEISPELLTKYLNGECSSAEQQQVETWLEAEKNKAPDLPGIHAERMEASIWESVAPLVEGDHTTQVIPLYRKAVRYAAAVIILLTIGILAYDHLYDPVRHGDIAYFEGFESIQTQRGQKRTVTLVDGSTIQLNYETEVKVPREFDGDERVVYLTGHAHFDIARDPEKPFIIYTHDSKTQVLGTSFDINTKGEEATEIIVTSGKVAFSEKYQSDDPVSLKVNDRAVLRPGRGITINEVDAIRLTAWTEDRLVFDNKTLREVIEVLESWYDIRIAVEDTDLMTQDFKLTMENPTLGSVMEALSFLGEFRYRIEGQKVTIY